VRLRRADCRGQAHASGQPIKTIAVERNATPAGVAQDVERLLMKIAHAANAGGSSALRQPRQLLGFGLSTGKVAPAPLGSGAWLEYTVVGDTMNIAQRRQDRARPASWIVLSERTDAHPSCPSRPAAGPDVGERDGSWR
jgi:class 3 adenylate cyclase